MTERVPEQPRSGNAWKLTKDPEQVLATLLVVLANKNSPYARAAAAALLGELGAAAGSAVPQLEVLAEQTRLDPSGLGKSKPRDKQLIRA